MRYILYGEWLVKHKVNYDPEFMNRFWIFDVYDNKEHDYMKYPDYYDWLLTYNLDVIPTYLSITDPTMDMLMRMVQEEKHTPKSNYGAVTIEGLVYKNYDFVNRFGNKVYMKAVTKDFYEVHRTVMEGARKTSDPEMYLVHKYQTPARMDKMYHKLVDDHGSLQMKNVSEFMSRVLYDLFTEEAWNMFMKDKSVKKAKFDMALLRKVSMAMSKNWFVDRLRQRGTDEEGSVNRLGQQQVCGVKEEGAED